MKIVSWNVNGIRSIFKKGFFEYLVNESPDILCLQEVKASIEQADDEIKKVPGYNLYWNAGTRAGYAGVATYTKITPKSISFDFGIPDDEGRVIVTEFDSFILYNIYFPNGQMNEERLKFKMGFYEAFLKEAAVKKNQGKKIIVSGDFNTAHKEIDLAHPKANENRSGFLPIERDWMDRWVKEGFVDSFRYFNKEPHNYSWWSYRMNARKKNVGWRIDYHFISDNFITALKGAEIQSHVTGSDHCPIVVHLKLKE